MRHTNAWYTRLSISVAIATSLSSVAYAGPGVWTSGGPYGGSVIALAINPTTPATLYAGTLGGGGRGIDRQGPDASAIGPAASPHARSGVSDAGERRGDGH